MLQLGKHHDFDRALELFLELQMGNMDPTRVVVAAFLGACVENSRPRPARQLIEVGGDREPGSCGQINSNLVLQLLMQPVRASRSAYSCNIIQCFVCQLHRRWCE